MRGGELEKVRELRISLETAYIFKNGGPKGLVAFYLFAFIVSDHEITPPATEDLGHYFGNFKALLPHDFI